MPTKSRKSAAYKEKMRRRRITTMSWLNIIGVSILSLIILFIGKCFLSF